MISENSVALPDLLPKGLKIANKWVYDPCGFEFAQLRLAAESKEYSSCSFELNGRNIQYRVSKITPKKTGQFVAIWKRNQEGITVPFDISDKLDFIIITAAYAANFGQFIFPKSILAAHGIIARNGEGGKRGIRVYPPWDAVSNKQAAQTQKWQGRYFLTIDTDKPVDLDRAIALLASI